MGYFYLYRDITVYYNLNSAFEGYCTKKFNTNILIIKTFRILKNKLCCLLTKDYNRVLTNLSETEHLKHRDPSSVTRSVQYVRTGELFKMSRHANMYITTANWLTVSLQLDNFTTSALADFFTISAGYQRTAVMIIIYFLSYRFF